MKCLIISVFNQSGGYSDAATEQALALDSVGVDVVLRSVRMDSTNKQLSPKIKELHDKDLNNIDAILQHNLPDQFVYKGGVRNFGCFSYETNSFQNSNWENHLKLMDKIIVPCSFMKDTIPKSIKDRTEYIPFPINTKKFDNQYELMDFGLPKNCLKLYTIAEYNKRKNIPGLLVSYLSSFTSNDNVALVLKTYLKGASEEDSQNHIKKIIEDIKKGLNRFQNPLKYPKVILITQYLTDDVIMSLHRTCDCFVTFSRGEAYCIPAIEAACEGNVTILPNHSSFKDFGEISGTLVDSQETAVFGMQGVPQGLYTSDETWGNCSTSKFSEAMKTLYNNHQKGKWKKGDFSENATYIKNIVSREAVGLKLKNLLEGSL